MAKESCTSIVGGQSIDVSVDVSGQKASLSGQFRPRRDAGDVESRLQRGDLPRFAEGKNGFKLSLRGYDPIFDHRALTDDLEGRRFNRAAPERSLMLLKTSGAVPHVGGVVCQPGDPAYELLKIVDRPGGETRFERAARRQPGRAAEKPRRSRRSARSSRWSSWPPIPTVRSAT